MKQFHIEQKIRDMKKGGSFFVAGEKERQAVNRAAATLHRAGVITFTVITRWDDAVGKFKVAAI